MLAKPTPQERMLALAGPLEKGLARLDGLRKNTPFCREILWRLMVYQITLPDSLLAPARAATLARGYYPDVRVDAQLLMGHVFPPVEVVAGFALYLEETYGGVGEAWLKTLVEGVGRWPVPPLIDNQAEAAAYTDSLLPCAKQLHASLLAIIEGGKPRPKASLGGSEKPWQPQSPQQIERNKKRLRNKTRS